MGIFNFFNKKNGIDKNVATPALEVFKLKVSDFQSVSHESEVISVKVSDDFNELFADYIIGSPKQAGDKIKLDSCIAKVNLWEQPVEIITTSKLNPEDLEYINNKLNWISQNKNVLDLKITHDLLELKNKNWLKENQAPLNEELFLKLISIDSINFISNSEIKLTYNDDGLFDGHDITLDLNTKNEIIKVGI